MSKAMAIMRPAPVMRWGAPLAAFLAVLAVLAVLNREPETNPLAGIGAAEVTRDGIAGPTEEQIVALQDAIRSDPDAPASYSQLGEAFLQRARETADPSYYDRAENAFAAALDRDPDELTATVGQGTLALARHDFRAGLELGRRALAIEPQLVRPYSIIADAQIELGRYEAAAATLDRMVSLKPTLAAYARVSYFRELHGDLDGAVQAMRLATAAGGGSVEASAYVEGLLGNLEIDRGRPEAARQAFGRALALDPAYAPALAGLARLDAAAGRYEPSIRSLRDVVERLPLPEYALALGEIELAAGRRGAARRDLALVDAQAGLLEESGVNTDAELARFEADHGSAARAVALARGAWRSAPSVVSADALSWSLFKAGRLTAAERFSARAMKLGSASPLFLFHAGMIALKAGRSDDARRWLGEVVARAPGFHPLHGPQAERALRGLT